MMTKKKYKDITESAYGSEIEADLAKVVVENEYNTAKSNNDVDYADYDSLIDKVESIRSEKNYDWRSDISLGVFLSHLLTDASEWVGQYFQTRDFVEVYLEGDTPEDKLKAKACKKLINKSLNIKDIYHFHKYVRARMINWMFGQVWALCYWEQDIRKKTIKQPPITAVNPVYNDLGQVVDRKIVSVAQPDKEIEEIIVDRFNYTPVDPRNIFTDFSYTYSAQDKPWIIVRSDDKTFQDLERDKDKFNYINLDLLKERLHRLGETDTSRESYNKNNVTKNWFSQTPTVKFDILDRYGKMWSVVDDRDEDDNPIKITPAKSQDGMDADSELVECIVSFAVIGSSYTLIRFDPTPFIDSMGKPYKPLVRGWCYIHPSRDYGLSDGKNLRDIDTAINDTLNISNDRVMLATLPVMKGRKLALDNNPTVFIEPENVIKLEDINQDLAELVIRDNIGGAMQQLGVLKGAASELDSIYPPQMGGMAGKQATATETGAAESHANARGGFKALTFEYTYLIEKYNMMNQMTYRFARPETLVKLVGEELAPHFDPNADYTYVPLSQSIESEHNKMRKVSLYDQMMGRLAGLAKIFPKEVGMLAAKIVGKQFELLGNEYQEFASVVDGLANAKPQEEGKGAEQTGDQAPPPTSNQTGLPMSGHEMAGRLRGQYGGMNMQGMIR